MLTGLEFLNDVSDIILLVTTTGASCVAAGALRASGRFSPVSLSSRGHQHAPAGLHAVLRDAGGQFEGAAPLPSAGSASRVVLSDPHAGHEGTIKSVKSGCV